MQEPDLHLHWIVYTHWFTFIESLLIKQKQIEESESCARFSLNPNISVFLQIHLTLNKKSFDHKIHQSIHLAIEQTFKNHFLFLKAHKVQVTCFKDLAVQAIILLFIFEQYLLVLVDSLKEVQSFQ